MASELKPTYTGVYDEKTRDIADQIANRPDFQYNASDDQLYQQYVDRYMQQGRQAMMDTIGQGAALTGGYNNSYAQAVGQQTYDQYLTGLNDKLMQTYQMAYQGYKDKGDQLGNLFSIYGTLGDQDYQRLLQEANARNGAGDTSLMDAMFGITRPSGGGDDGWYGGYGGDADSDGKEKKVPASVNVPERMPDAAYFGWLRGLGVDHL